MHSFLNSPLIQKPVTHLVILTILVAVLFGVGLGGRPFSAPSEARYVEIGREMAESGDFVTPRLDYVKYFEKPPLFYWIQAVSTKYLGIGTFAARLPTALFAVFLCLLTFFLGDMLYGRLAAWLSALTLATSIYVFSLSRVVLVDMPVSVFLVATLTCFLYAVRTIEGKKRTWALYAMYAAAACAVLSKGLIGAVLPGIIVMLWLAMTNNWKLLKDVRLGSGIALFLLIAVPWHVLVSLRNPEFPHFYFIHEHFERYLTTQHGRYQPDWFFLVVLVVGLFPWFVFAAQAASHGLKGFWQERLKDGSRLFLVIWILFILVFFSLSDSKLIPYILPIFPPVTVLIGHYLADAWEEKPIKYFGLGLFFMALILLAMTIAPMLLPVIFDAQSKVMEAVVQAGNDIHSLSIAAVISAGALFITCIQGSKRHIILVVIVIAAMIMQFGDMVAGHYNKDSMVSIAQAIKELDKPGDEAVLYDEYYQDLPVYLARKVSVVSWKATELNFGASHEDASAWMIDEPEFWRRWMKNDHRMFVVMRTESFERITTAAHKTPEELQLNLITQSGRNLLLMNQIPDRKRP